MATSNGGSAKIKAKKDQDNAARMKRLGIQRPGSTLTLASIKHRIEEAMDFAFKHFMVFTFTVKHDEEVKARNEAKTKLLKSLTDQLEMAELKIEMAVGDKDTDGDELTKLILKAQEIRRKAEDVYGGTLPSRKAPRRLVDLKTGKVFRCDRDGEPKPALVGARTDWDKLIGKESKPFRIPFCPTEDQVKGLIAEMEEMEAKMRCASPEDREELKLKYEELTKQAKRWHKVLVKKDRPVPEPKPMTMKMGRLLLDTGRCPGFLATRIAQAL